jgi:hypothetical protein
MRCRQGTTLSSGRRARSRGGAAVGHAPFRIEGDEIHGDGALSWRIKLRKLPQRRIALVTLPVLDVELVIDASSGTEAQAFVDLFPLGFQRAGG